jgi:RNA polymerase sigma factor (sigma-70 family)
MERALTDRSQAEQDRRIAEAIERERPRLRNFIRRRVRSEGDADDILQEVFYELVEALRGTHAVELASAWFIRVARNRIIDLFRRKKTTSLSEPVANETGGDSTLEDLLPSPDAGPDAEYLRTLVAEHLEEALDELPEEQRAAFLANEIEGRSFREMAAESGVSINTLISRKRYAIQHLRERLQSTYDDWLEG